jgi:cation:H+ antiporter
VDWALLALTLVVILGGAELFTNGVEWVGENLGLSDGVVGSVLAAIGTALPETVLPLIAILLGHEEGDHVGIGAIIGAPLMLTTLAMFVLGLTVVIFSARGRRGLEIQADRRVPMQDLMFFLGMFSVALLAGVVHVAAFRWTVAAALLIAYGLYVRKHFRNAGGRRLEREAASGVRPLYLRELAGRFRRSEHRVARSAPPVWASVTQTLIGLAVIVVAARFFVTAVTDIAHEFHFNPLAFSLLVAPVATELPETFNAGVIWARRGKDTLAIGNITGAMVFQSAFPVAIGLTLTPWRLTSDSLVAGLIALFAGSVLLMTLLVRRRFNARLLLLQGLLYAGYVAYILTRLD